MEHKTCLENLSAYLDGELPGEEKLLLEAHLAGCPDCGKALAELKSLSLIIHKHAMEPVPVSLKNKVFAEKREKPAFYLWLKPALGVSMAAAGVLLVFNLAKSPQQEPMAPLPGLPRQKVSAPAAGVPMEGGLLSQDAGRAGGSGVSVSGSRLFSAAGSSLDAKSANKPAENLAAAGPADSFSMAKTARADHAAPMESSGPEMERNRPEAGRDAGSAGIYAETLSGGERAATGVRGSARTETFAQPKASRPAYIGQGAYKARKTGAGFKGVPAVAGASAQAAGDGARGDRNHISVSCKGANQEQEAVLSPAMKKALYGFSPGFKLRAPDEYSARIREHYCYSPNSSPSAVVGDFNGDGTPDAYLIGYEDNWLERIALISDSAGTYEAVSLGKSRYDGLEAAVKGCSWCYDKEKKLRNAYYLQPKGTSYMCGGDYWVERSLENDGVALLDLWEKGLYISYVSIWAGSGKKLIEQHCVLNPCSEEKGDADD